MSDCLHAEESSKISARSSYPIPEAMDLVSEILAQLTEGVVTLTYGGTVISWNGGAERLTGYTMEAINTVGLEQLFDPPEHMTRLLQQASAGTAILDVRLLMQRADGQAIPVGIRCSPLQHLGRTHGRVVLVMRDLSELETLQTRLLQSERLNLLGRLAGSVSHEIRNPLTAIFLHTDLLEDELRQSENSDRGQLIRSLNAIKNEVTHLYDLVQQYLSLARLSELQCDPAELCTYLQETRDELEARLTARGIALQWEQSVEELPVALHRSSFQRLLLNLVNNAVEAMSEGGTLTLRLYRRDEQACLEIQDTGCGIPAEQIPRLFNPFHTTKPEGTGLGLYLVQEIVTAHHGVITVSSTERVGTTFTVALPLLTGETPILSASREGS